MQCFPYQQSQQVEETRFKCHSFLFREGRNGRCLASRFFNRAEYSARCESSEVFTHTSKAAMEDDSNCPVLVNMCPFLVNRFYMRDSFSFVTGDDTYLIGAVEVEHWSLDVNRNFVVRVRHVVGVQFARRSCGPVLDDRLEALTDDVGAMQMVTLAHLNGRVHLYVVHNVSEPEVIHMIEYKVDEGGEEVAPSVEGIEEGGEGAQLAEGIEDGVRQELDEGAEEVDGEAAVSAYGLQQERIEAEEENGETERTTTYEVQQQRIQAEEVDGEVERTTTYEVQQQRIKAEEVDAMQIHVQDGVEVEAEMIEVDENDVQRTEAAEVELEAHSIEVDRAEAAEVEVEAHSIEVDRAEAAEVEVEVDSIDVDRAEAAEVEDGEGDTLHGEPYRIEVGDLDDVQESDDAEKDGEMDNEDELVDIDVQCDVSESCSDLEVEVEPFLPGSDSDMDDDEINYSKLSSPHNGDEDSEQEGYGHFSTFIQPKNMLDFNWEVGTYFVDKEDILDAIKSYAVENRKNLKLVKNDKKQIRVRCLGSKGECPWVTYFGFMGAVKSWQLRIVVDSHTCSRKHKVRLFNAKWLSRKLEKTVRENPNVKGVDIREKVTRKWNIAISKNMAYRAKTYASDEVGGSFTKQYSRIFYYAHELLARNPGSTIKVKVEPYDGKAIFQRFYTCLKACKDSFVSCKPIIGLDGAFLKGKHDGELLTAVARDANDQMLPLAYAIVEVENKDTWTWFLELLIEDLGGPNMCSGLTVMSDQQKEVKHQWNSLCACIDNNERTTYLYGLKSQPMKRCIPPLYPINGKHLWEVTQCPDVLAPPKRQLSGRPKKKRRLEQWELKKSTTKMSKGGLLKRCTICREVEAKCRKRENPVHCLRVNQMEQIQIALEECYMF
ncbi:hypothetical protein V8G54_001910 [Vigna mungo]|uniref:Transposase MuDR plant domain-containing protein n=1 Tax=Vigna mungo TaxID=3915 RepID=A0AAQ3P757_VIGMU